MTQINKAINMIMEEEIVEVRLESHGHKVKVFFVHHSILSQAGLFLFITNIQRAFFLGRLNCELFDAYLFLSSNGNHDANIVISGKESEVETG